jgi:predicted RNase H-like HicB family nuclease
MVLEDLAEENEPIPEGPEGEVSISEEPPVAINR